MMKMSKETALVPLDDDNEEENEIVPTTSNKDAEATWEHEDLAKVYVLVFRGHTAGVNSCCFMESDKTFVSASDDHTVRIWDIDRQENIAVLSAHENKVNCCRVSFDGRRIASAGWDHKVIVWDTLSGKPLWNALHDGIVTTCDFSYDGKFLITGSDLENSVRIWDAYDGELIKELKHHKNTVTCCRFSSLSYRFCTTSMDRTTHLIDMQNYHEEIMPHTVLKVGGHGNVVSCASFSGDDRHLCTGSWDKNLQMWDLNAGVYRREGPVTLKNGHDGSISSCIFSQDGSTLLSASYDQTVTIWDAKLAFKKLTLQGHTDWVTNCDVSKDSKLVLSSSKDHTIRVWNIERSEDIPIVVQNKLSIGVQMMKCRKCNKPFSISNAQDPESIKYCVFCRLKEPIKPFKDGIDLISSQNSLTMD
eukprot:Seg2754.6 transcript_id=Seg2754.6/GoldUCD/mRNA.D3Y31 product="WD repeat-containing protein 88" protein_id=Seg2754.6/GoldUCD/D3Y31